MPLHFFYFETLRAKYKWQLRFHVSMIRLAFLSITALTAYINMLSLFSFLRTKYICFVLSVLHFESVVINLLSILNHLRCLMCGECRPAFTVFICSQAGKDFEVLGKRHSISRLLSCLLYFILLFVGPKLSAKADNQGSRFVPRPSFLQ